MCGKIQEEWESNSNSWEKLRDHSNLVRIDSVAGTLDLMYIVDFKNKNSVKSKENQQKVEENIIEKPTKKVSGAEPENSKEYLTPTAELRFGSKKPNKTKIEFSK